ncbi:hypothetical protein ABIC94_004842 [Variovorax paradoxus]|uniref:hypothetical protein n=1 Tax=Variovorax paradoxus TaxID=34073 RepID=UPI0033938237
MKEIKLMADYGCFPLWKAGPGEYGNIDPRSLAISLKLQAELIRWADAFNQTLDAKYPSNSGFKNNDDELAFRRETLRLTELLRAELGPEYVVNAHL